MQLYKRANCMPMGVLTHLGQDKPRSLEDSFSETRLSCLISAVDFLLSTSYFLMSAVSVCCPLSTVHGPLDGSIQFVSVLKEQFKHLFLFLWFKPDFEFAYPNLFQPEPKKLKSYLFYMERNYLFSYKFLFDRIITTRFMFQYPLGQVILVPYSVSSPPWILGKSEKK